MASALSSPTRWLYLATTALLLSINPVVSFSSSSSCSSSNTQRSNKFPTTSSTSLNVASTPPQTTEYDIVKVDLANGRDYPIYIGSDFTDSEASTLLRKHIHGKRVLLITNDRIAPMYLERYQQLISDNTNSNDDKELTVDTVVLPDGEENKSYDVMALILDKALELGLDRKSTFVALGGGVIGDMVGFASAIYQRGVNFIQVSFFFCC
jgi:3-dehydroquinate synthase